MDSPPQRTSVDAAAPSPRLAYKISEAAEALGVSTATIRRLIDRGLIKPSRILRHVLIPSEELARLLKS